MNNGNKFIGFFSRRKKLLFGVIILILVGWFVKGMFSQSTASSDQSGNGSDSGISQVNKINKTYQFFGRAQDDTLTSEQVALTFEGVHRESEVLIKGNRAAARNNKVFLVFDLAVKNDTSDILYLNPVDLVRWVESSDTLIAPQVNQGTVEIRPQSTKKTNIGFVVSENMTNITLQIGELNGSKEQLEIKL